jgi:signal transduction histidine kinase
MKQLRSFFRSIRFKLMLSFLGVMILSLCLFQLSTSLMQYQGNVFTPQFQQFFFTNELQSFSTEAAFYLKPPLDQTALQTWLKHKVESRSETATLTLAPSRGNLQFIGAVNQSGRILALCGDDIQVQNNAISSQPKLSAEEQTLLDNTLQGHSVTGENSGLVSNQTIFVAATIPATQGHIQGALFLKTKVITPWEIITTNTITSLLTSILILIHVLPITILLCIFLYYYSHRFSQHICQLTEAARRWSQGDFSVTVQNNRKDEVGQLTQNLNGMVKQIKHVIEVQKDLAGANERNRLARELHDTIKQQVFALNFQIAIARKLHQPEEDQLAQHLDEAQNILQDIQKEMTNLIFPMRQAALANQDLADALAAYLSRWSYQYGIFVKFTANIEGQEKNFGISHRIKETFFRVAQEALSNIARHSEATYVQVILTIGWLYVTLKISDNGKGFDQTQQKKLGMGLSSMEERIKAIHGQLQITNLQPSGTEVLATYKSQEAGLDVATIPTYKSDKRRLAADLLLSPRTRQDTSLDRCIRSLA